MTFGTVVFRMRNEILWSVWDGKFENELSLKNSLFQCISELGDEHQIGIVVDNYGGKTPENYNISEDGRLVTILSHVLNSYSVIGGDGLVVLSDGINNYSKIEWDFIPKHLHKEVLNCVNGSSKMLKYVSFDLKNPQQFLLWSKIKLYGTGF